MGSVAFAGVPSSRKHEVEYLLQFVEESACVLERNGKKHSGAEAVKHIKKKYHYFRGDITTTEDFISYSATKSTMSGKFYMVYCPGVSSSRASEWLLSALYEYRNSIKSDQ